MTTEDPKAKDNAPLSGIKNPNIWAISITASVVASILFVSIFQPILNGTGKIAISWLSTFATSFVDNGYNQAPVAATNAILFHFIAIVTGLTTGMGIFTILISSGFTSRLLQDIIFRTKAQNNAETIDEQNKANNALREVRILTRVLGVAFGLAIIFLVSATAVSYYITIQANASFERQIMALKPHISDTEEELLYSEWANVDTKSDYELLMARMDYLARDRHADIPKRFI